MSLPKFAPNAFSGLAFALTPPLQATPYQRMLIALLPPGRLWGALTGVLAAVLLASGDELARVDSRCADLLDESDPSTTIELLPESEAELALPIDASLSISERQARVVGRLVARQRCRPVDLQQSLAVLLVQAPADVVVIERSPAFAASIGDAREIKRFFVYRDPALPGTAFIASAQTLLNAIKRSTTVGTVIESINMLYDDPRSLYDRDLLGA